MSVFNARKDRDGHGKAKPHFRVKYASPDAKLMHHRDRRNWENMPRCNYSANPADWNRLYTTRRRRADDLANCRAIELGYDPEGVLWSPDRYPTEYYW
ncbi:hypothetical protein GTB64_004531 [Salmonella enterica]|nr:hypothetical protein [Salmonella enterica]